MGKGIDPIGETSAQRRLYLLTRQQTVSSGLQDKAHKELKDDLMLLEQELESMKTITAGRDQELSALRLENQRVRANEASIETARTRDESKIESLEKKVDDMKRLLENKASFFCVRACMRPCLKYANRFSSCLSRTRSSCARNESCRKLHCCMKRRGLWRKMLRL